MIVKFLPPQARKYTTILHFIFNDTPFERGFKSYIPDTVNSTALNKSKKLAKAVEN
jgi:hypothetical protein